ncbi:hypothetical protein ALC53_12170 [Atta colombica]|uniref:Uncharacterized protein n=1 Tax=Atta colombica TaxID=520822 RepID=A0A151HZH8_9HYME|nr:hypothetical protein ALC53_12170 [Atta colombica]
MKWQPAQVYVYLIERVSQPTKKEKEGERGRMRTTNKGREPKSRRNYDAKRADTMIREQDDPQGRALSPSEDFAFESENRSYAHKTGFYTTLPD